MRLHGIFYAARMQSTEQRSKSKEQRAKSKDERAKMKEQRDISHAVDMNCVKIQIKIK